MASGVEWRGHAHRLVRYAGVSVIGVSVTVVGLALLVGVLNLPAGWANFAIVTAFIPVNFELSRRWVWARRDGGWRRPDVILFAVFSFAGLALSTLCVHEVGLAVTRWSHPGRALAADVANLSAFGCLWVAEYLVVDRWLWPTATVRAGQPDISIVD
jgi:putative flippase GtrA